MQEIVVAVALFTLVVMALGAIILLSRSWLVASGAITINVNGERDLQVSAGGKLLNVLSGANLFLPSACGGGGTCGQCTVKILEGGGPLLPIEKAHISRRAAREGMHLACQVNVSEDMRIEVPEDVFGVNRWECTVRSND
ncbi:MAG: 2Fe-2S iron-sulfur cluster-binding protein, partial [Gammaproteobacteria bacterium]